MGPLVYYCRWQGLKLRLSGRDSRFVWGQLVPADGTDEAPQPFRFDLESWVLEIGEGENRTRIQLDELGVEVKPAKEPPARSTAGDEPR
jgi:hypothetical protein